MTKFIFNIKWEMQKEVTVEAEDLESAIDMAHDDYDTDGGTYVPVSYTPELLTSYEGK